MLSKRMLMVFLSVSMLVFVAVGQAYGRSDVAAENWVNGVNIGGVAAFLDPGDQGGIIFPWNINDGTSAGSVSDWLNNPFQVAPTWQITLPGVFGLNTVSISLSSHGDTGSNPDDFVVELGLNGKFSPVVSMRNYDYVAQSTVTFGPAFTSWGAPAYSRANAGQDVVQILLADTIRFTEFNAADVDAGQSGRPHSHQWLDEINAYDEGWPFDMPVHTRPLSPTGVRLLVDGKTLTWNAVVGAIGYNVWISRAETGSLSPDYFCVNQLPGPFSYLNDGMLTGTSYTLPLAWQGAAVGLYAVTSVDSTGTNSFYVEAISQTLEERVAAIEAILAGGVGGGLTAAQVQAMIDASITADNVDDDAEIAAAVGAEASARAAADAALQAQINALRGAYNSHVHDKGSGGRNTTTPIPQIQ